MKELLSICFMLLATNALAQPATSNNHHPKTFTMPSCPGCTDSVTVKQYYFVMLTSGPDRDKIKDAAAISKLQEGHMANIRRLYKEGKLLLAGPFGDDKQWRGIFVFDCETQEEVEQLLATDPMIKAGRLAYEIHPWWTGMNSVFK